PVGTIFCLAEDGIQVPLVTAVQTCALPISIGPTAVPTAVVWSAMFETVGGSFTAFTVNTKLSLALNCPSLTVTVIVAVPFWLSAGFTVTVRLAPEPPNPMFPLGTCAGSDELPRKCN